MVQDVCQWDDVMAKQKSEPLDLRIVFPGELAAEIRSGADKGGRTYTQEIKFRLQYVYGLRDERGDGDDR